MIFRQSMSEMGLKVEHSTAPIALELTKEESRLTDPAAYVAKVIADTNAAESPPQTPL